MIEYLGIGVGLRRPHFHTVLENKKDVDWFELVSENFMGFGGRPRAVITELHRKKVPMVCHGLGLSLGSSDQLNHQYLAELKNLIEFVDAPWFSDHLCLSSAKEIQFHDLLPVLKTEESLNIIVNKINQLAKVIDHPFAFENISYYMESSHNTMSELEFIQELLKQTQSYMLLDINNVYVNAMNFGFDAKEFLKAIPAERVVQIHLAGHDDSGEVIIDTHGAQVPHPVWKLYQWYLEHTGKKISTLIEWDHNIPDYDTLNKQAKMAKEIINKVFS
ncbi:MAG: DUF692 domain-containing protein [Halobacteriovoraceae bacterium]|nr:DUF692 domain-containing protein [Halobacteriovoraceae bacterium]MCB9095393.1 DUF692 domain-containing protein [Halobacteriovoraceae bacterium]